jgi:HK97 family phage major capsid protein
VEIETKADALRVLSEIKSEQKRLADANRDLNDNVIEKMASDLKDVQQKLAEAAAPKVETVSEKEATLRYHVKADGSLDVAGLVNDDTDRGEWHAEFKRLVDDRNFTKMLTRDGRGSDALEAKLHEHVSKAPPMIQRAFSDAAGVGSTFIPDLLLPELRKKLYVPTALEAAFPSFNMPGKECKFPFSTGAVAPFLKNAATWSAITAMDDTTSQISATAQSFGARITADEDTVADSVVPALDYFRDSLTVALQAGVESCILNGDTTDAHADLHTTASPRLWSEGGRWNTGSVASTAADHRRAFIGLRAAAFDASTGRDASTMTYADILETRSSLDNGYQAASDLLMIVSPIVMTKWLLQLTETKSLDVFGPNAGILNGSIGKLGGMDIIVSGAMTDDLSASGVYDGSVTTKTGYVICHRPSWLMGNYKPQTIDIDREITKGQIEIVGTRRCALIDMSNGAKSVAYGYNVAKS